MDLNKETSILFTICLALILGLLITAHHLDQLTARVLHMELAEQGRQRKNFSDYDNLEKYGRIDLDVKD